MKTFTIKSITLAVALIALGSLNDLKAMEEKSLLNKQLLTAARDADGQAVKRLIEAGADVNAQDPDGISVLDWAATNLSTTIETIQELIKAGAKVSAQDKKGETALHTAASVGNSKIVKALLDADPKVVNVKNNQGDTALHIAAWKGQEDVIPVLLDLGADIEAQENTGGTPLIVAAAQGKVNTVKALLASGANINAQGSNGLTSLHEAVSRGKTPVIKLLLAEGADPNIKSTGKVTGSHTPFEMAGYDEAKKVFLTHTSPQEIQHIIPFFIALKQKGLFPKDIRKLLANYMVQAVVTDKLKKAKEHLPRYDEDTLRKEIEDSVITALKKRTETQEQEKKSPTVEIEDPFGTW